jgi:hypothetical protein
MSVTRVLKSRPRRVECEVEGSISRDIAEGREITGSARAARGRFPAKLCSSVKRHSSGVQARQVVCVTNAGATDGRRRAEKKLSSGGKKVTTASLSAR